MQSDTRLDLTLCELMSNTAALLLDKMLTLSHSGSVISISISTTDPVSKASLCEVCYTLLARTLLKCFFLLKSY